MSTPLLTRTVSAGRLCGGKVESVGEDVAERQTRGFVVRGTTRAKVPQALEEYCKQQGKSLEQMKQEAGFGRGLFARPNPNTKNLKLYY